MDLFKNRYQFHDFGLLFLRVGIGLLFTIHGYPKLTGGPEKWLALGGVMKLVGIHFAPTFWGFMAAIAEAVGGQMLAVGLFWRLACVLLLGTMIMATISHLVDGADFNTYSHSLESSILFAALLFIGPGRYSLDQLLFPASRRLY